jgi:hypothetical protein
MNLSAFGLSPLFGMHAMAMGLSEVPYGSFPTGICSIHQGDNPLESGGAATARSLLPEVAPYPENPYVRSLESYAEQLGVRSPDVEVRAPRSYPDFVRMFATEQGIRAFLNADIVDGLAQEWDAEKLRATKTRLIHAYWTLSHLEEIRQANREVLAEFEKMNPGREAGSILATLARETHESWLAGERSQAYFVPYTQALHDFLADALAQGTLASSQKGSGPISPELLVHPKKKHKFSAADFRFASDEQRAATAAKFAEVTGRSFESGFVINTVAGDWDALSALSVTGNDEWPKVRPGYLFGLQADSVGAVLAAFQDLNLMADLSEGAVDDKLQLLVEILRRVNVGWRVNNPWNGFNSPLLNRPFALAEDGGIGIGDILRDALVLKPILESFERFRVEGRLNAKTVFKTCLQTAFENGLSEALERMVDEAALTQAIRISSRRYRENI